MSKQLDDILALEAVVENRFEHFLDSARSAHLEPEPWAAILTDLEVEPLHGDARRAQLEGAMPQQTGAIPLEVRAGLEGLQRRYRIRVEFMRSHLSSWLDGTDSTPYEAVLDRVESQIRSRIEMDMESYLESVRPRVQLGGIFANAMASTKTYGEVEAGVETLSCSTCGASRPAGSDLQRCDYCGRDFFS